MPSRDRMPSYEVPRHGMPMYEVSRQLMELCGTKVCSIGMKTHNDPLQNRLNFVPQSPWFHRDGRNCGTSFRRGVRDYIPMQRHNMPQSRTARCSGIICRNPAVPSGATLLSSFFDRAFHLDIINSYRQRGNFEAFHADGTSFWNPNEGPLFLNNNY